MHRETQRKWTTITFQVSQQEEALSLKVQWYGVLGPRINHVVRMREDTVKLRVVLCTDETLSKESILERDPNVVKRARGEKKTVERRSTGEQEMAKAA